MMTSVISTTCSTLFSRTIVAARFVLIASFAAIGLLLASCGDERTPGAGAATDSAASTGHATNGAANPAIETTPQTVIAGDKAHEGVVPGGTEFSVTLPAGYPKPSQGAEEIVTTSAGKIAMYNFVARRDGASNCYLGYGDADPAIARLSDKVLLDEVERDAVDKGAGVVELERREATTVGGYPARRMWLTLKLPNGTVHILAQMIYARPRLVQLSIGSPNRADLDSPDVLAFMNSFKKK